MSFASPAPAPVAGDTEGWIQYLVDGERPFASARAPFDADDARALAAVVVERTRDLDAMVSNHPVAPQGDRWRERLGEVEVPVAVVHGADDPLFPLGNGQALARELPGSTLHVLPGMGHELPRRARPAIAALIVDTIRRAEGLPTPAPIDEVVDEHFGGDHLQASRETS